MCVTLDDGYRDNLTDAKALQERADIPATKFVASGALDAWGPPRDAPRSPPCGRSYVGLPVTQTGV